MHTPVYRPFYNKKLVISIYLLLITFITLLLVLSASGDTSSLSTGDIDNMLGRKWDEKGLKPSKKSGDSEFLRRIYLDLTGRIPNAYEVKTFLDDNSPNKRAKKIDDLLASEEYGEFLADTWLQILFSYDGKRRVQAPVYSLIRNEFANSFNINEPYTEFVSKLISAEGFVSTNPYAMYIGRFENPEDAAGNVMKVFAGKQIQCAQCHKHPYEKITQEDFYGVASFFSRRQILPLLQKNQAEKITSAIVKYEKQIDKLRDREMEMNTEGNMEMNEEMSKKEEHRKLNKNKKPKKNENKFKRIPPEWAIDSLKSRMRDSTFKPDLLVWDAINGQLTYEVKGEKKTAYPKYLGGASVSGDAGVQRRTLFAENLTKTESKQLAMAFVNRFWKHFFGYGFINPVDDFTSGDEGSNPELLNMLADEFVRSNFDVKNLFRLITNTEAYQLSSTPNSTNKEDHENFSRSVLRPMDPVQLSNSLLTSSGYFNTGGLKNKNEDELNKIRFRILQLFIYTFEDDEMNEAEDFSGTITQALLMMNSEITEKISEKKPGNFLAQIMKKYDDPEERIEMIFLNTIGRYPTNSEKEFIEKNISGEGDKPYEDLQWALINSSEFIFNH